MLVTVPSSTLAVLRRGAGVRPDYINDLHTKQRAFVDDQSRRKTALCGRRAGKTHGIGAWLVDGAEQRPRRKSLYVALTRGKAKSILWDGCLEQMSHTYGLGLRLRHDEGQLVIQHPNGHKIWLLGVDNSSEVDKVRGEALFRAVVDEAQAFGDYAAELIEQSIEPSLMDMQGCIALTGTPSPIAGGYFWAATTGDNPDFAQWPVHHWTVLDNEAIPHAEAELAEIRERHHWTEEHPTYRREWLGQWTDDVGSLIYPMTRELNGWSPLGSDMFGLPAGHEYQFGLGVDLGFGEKSTAFTLCAVKRGSGELYTIRSYKRSRMIPTAVAGHVQALRDMVRNEADGAALRVVVDEGALGKGYAEQMRSMGVGCEAAKKTEKRTYQEYVRGLLQSGLVKVDFERCAELSEEARRLPFDDETGQEDDRYPNHCCDSFLYITRAMLPSYNPELEPPKPGTPEAINAEVAKHKQELIRERDKRLKRRRRN